MAFNEVQKKIVETYQHGEFREVSTLEEAYATGDGLFGFLLGEVSDVGGNSTDARERLAGAIEDIEHVRASL